jgi:hypothetical protein
MKHNFAQQFRNLSEQAQQFLLSLVKERGEIQVREIRESEDGEGQSIETIYEAPCYYQWGKYETYNRYAIDKLVLVDGKVMVKGLGASEGMEWDEDEIFLGEIEDETIIILADELERMIQKETV